MEQEKLYTVFVSSTYEDLREERQEVIQVLLETDCIPVGMEFFPASDDTQWDFIKQAIDYCDYYIVISAGKYGHCKDGVSYTEMEYEYAISKNIPIMSFIYQNLGELIGDKLEDDKDIKEKLKLFQDKLKNKMCKFFNNPSDLAGKVSIAINKIKKIRPRTGWIRAENDNIEIIKENNDLRKQIDKLKLSLESENYTVNTDYINLCKEDDIYDFKYKVVITDKAYSNTTYIINKDDPSLETYKVSWNDLLKQLQITTFDAVDNYRIFQNIDFRLLKDYDKTKYPVQENKKVEIVFPEFVLEEVLTQFQALGYIEFVRNEWNINYYRLTANGHKKVISLKAKYKDNK